MMIAEVMGGFARAWNAGDDASRLRLLEASSLPDAVFISPQETIREISAMCS
jgi:hypothetical protein